MSQSIKDKKPKFFAFRHIYHYYIHGPEGNTMMSRTRRNIGAMDLTIKVSGARFWVEKFFVCLFGNLVFVPMISTVLTCYN